MREDSLISHQSVFAIAILAITPVVIEAGNIHTAARRNDLKLVIKNPTRLDQPA